MVMSLLVILEDERRKEREDADRRQNFLQASCGFPCIKECENVLKF